MACRNVFKSILVIMVALGTFHISPVCVAEDRPDFVGSIKHIPGLINIPAQPSRFEIDIKNKGNVGVPATRAEFRSGLPQHELATFKVPALAPGQVHTKIVPFDIVVQPGWYTAYLELDVDREVREAREFNNHVRLSYEIEKNPQPQAPNLKGSIRYIAPDSNRIESKAGFEIIVHNDSGVQAPARKAGFGSNIPGHRPEIIDVPALAPGQQYSVTLTLDEPPQPGKYLADLSVDYQSNATEILKGQRDNHAYYEFEVTDQVSLLSDLTGSVRFVPANTGPPAETPRFEVTIQNRGDGVSSPVQARLDSGISGLSPWIWDVPSLSPGKMDYRQLALEQTPGPNTYSAQLVVDSGETAAELDEKNNWQTYTYEVKALPKPDLSGTVTYVSPPTDDTVPDNAAETLGRLDITIENRGQASAPSSIALLDFGISGRAAERLQVPSLPAGQRHTLSIVLPPETPAGRHTSILRVDVDSAANEVSEENNTINVAYQVPARDEREAPTEIPAEPEAVVIQAPSSKPAPVSTPPVVCSGEKAPQLDRWGASGDELYGIYRRGLITRHITKNGRLLQTVALKNIHSVKRDKGRLTVGRVDTEDWTCIPIGNKSNYWTVPYPDGMMRPIRVEEIRYALTPSPDLHSLTYQKPLLWVPVRAPMKVPGYSDATYEVIAAEGDNALYYGGLALATFSLEYLYKVSDHSIGYARRLMEYFYASEMNGDNGYLVRINRHFNSNRNYNGEPIIQGASAEELLGTMLGVMYYLKAEPDHHRRERAKAYRDRVLATLDKDRANYCHRFMKSTNKECYSAKPPSFLLTWALFASRGDHRKDLWIQYDTAIRSARSWVGDKVMEEGFETWTMLLYSAIIALDSDDLPLDKKRSLSILLMEEIIKEPLLNKGSKDSLRHNGMFAVVAQLINKYLPDNEKLDSEFQGADFKSKWRDHMGKWQELKNDIQVLYTCSPHAGAPLAFQCNLPVLSKKRENIQDDGIWLRHNFAQQIGHWFVWKYRANPNWRYPYHWSHGKHWLDPMPGWRARADWVETGSMDEFLLSSEKRYPQGDSLRHPLDSGGFIDYLTKERIESQDSLLSGGHTDLQVEGAGLGLIFFRMLLSHINKDEYNPPDIRKSGYDRPYKPLQTHYIEPYGLQFLHYEAKQVVQKIRGDRDKALRIVALPGPASAATNQFVVAFAGRKESLRLRTGYAADGGAFTLGGARQLGRFDEVELEVLQAKDGTNYLIVVDRAEHNDKLSRDEHWLRVSVWRVSGLGDKRPPALTRVGLWKHTHKNPDAARNIDIALTKNVTSPETHYLAVTFRSSNGTNRLKMFAIDVSKAVENSVLITPLDETATDVAPKNNKSYGAGPLFVTVANGDTVVSGANKLAGMTLVDPVRYTFSLFSREFQVGVGRHLVNPRSVLDVPGKLLALGTVPGKRGWGAGGDFVLAAYRLANSNLKITAWEVMRYGKLELRGHFDTTDAEQYLLGREAGWERAEFVPMETEWGPGFVLVGKGSARTLRTGHDPNKVEKKLGKNTTYRYESSDKGLKVLFGHLMEDGRPSLLSSNVIGSGGAHEVWEIGDDEMSMLDVAALISVEGKPRVVTANKRHDKRLQLIAWGYRNDTRIGQVDKPDLIVSELRVNKNKTATPVQLHTRVKNIGSQSTTKDTELTFTIDVTGADGTPSDIMDPLPVGILAPGESGVFTVPAPASHDYSGELVANVDANNLVDERYEFNNKRSVPIEVLLQDLAVEGFPQQRDAGKPINLKATVRNKHTADSPPAKVKFHVDGTKVGVANVATLTPGDEKTVFVTIAPKAAGQYQVTVEVVSEIFDNETSNNTAQYTLTVVSGVDLAVEGFPQQRGAGKVIKLEATVRNEGTAVSPLGKVKFYVDGTKVGVANVGTLTPGDEKTVFVNIAPKAAGQYQVTVEVVSKIADDPPSNSTAQYTLTVVQGVDLAVEGFRHNAHSGKVIKLEAAVRNEGTAVSPPGKVKFYVDGTKVGVANVGTLTPGDEKTVFVNIAPKVAGQYQVTVEVVSKIADDPPSNSTAQYTLTVVRGVDLAVDGFRHQGNTWKVIKLEATVRNEGTAVSPSGKVKFYVNGTKVGVANVGTLTPGDEKTVFVNIAPKAAGQYQVTVEVLSKIADDNTSNNTAQYTLTVVVPGAVKLPPLPTQNQVPNWMAPRPQWPAGRH